MDRPILRGLDSPDHLRAWMEAAGRQYVVLRVADILDMNVDDQRLILDILDATGTVDLSDVVNANVRSLIQGAGTNGYIKIDRDTICSLGLDDLAVVQQWLSVYREVRMGKGEPSRTDPCSACKGRGKVYGIECTTCGGEGVEITFLEISDEEAALSEGRTP